MALFRIGKCYLEGTIVDCDEQAAVHVFKQVHAATAVFHREFIIDLPLSRIYYLTDLSDNFGGV